jgi:tRNA U54 and U55 pseudouridine synthase Pus10
MNPRNEFLVAMAHNFLHDSCFRNWLTEYRAEEIANALEELLALREEIAARRKADEEPCEQCGGSGKVWPSVEGEIVVEECAYQLHTESIDDGNWALDIDVPGPGFYRIIVQPIDSKPCPS